MIKQIIRKSLRKRGYDLVKIHIPQKHNGDILLQIGNMELLLPPEHALPSFINSYPNYSRNLSRIANYLGLYYPFFSIIDVGANIGDSVALLLENSASNVHIYSVEGNPAFLPYLKHNVSSMSNVTIFETYLSDTLGVDRGGLLNENGTARIAQDEQSNKITFMTLDELSVLNTEFGQSKLLKIDTDGFDLKIIRGGLKYISKINPVLFFEYDFDFLTSIGDDAFSTLKTLYEIGYEHMLVYDNFGRLLFCLHNFDFLIFEQLTNYIEGKKGAIDYYDLCFLHKNDKWLFDDIQKREIEYFKKN